MSEVLDLFLKTVDRYCVFDMVGIVFASFFYCYYVPRSSMFITYIQHEWRTLILHEHTALVKSKPLDLKHSRQSYSRYLLRPFHQRLFFSIGPIWTSVSTMNQYFLIGPIVVLNRLEKWSATVFQHVQKNSRSKPSSRGRLGRPIIWWGWSAYTPSTLRTTLGRERQTLYESSRGRSRQGNLQGTLERPRRQWDDGFWSRVLSI